MKKLILLFTAGIAVVTVGAQQNNSVIFTHQLDASRQYVPTHNVIPQQSSSSNPSAKATNGGSTWFCFQDARKHTGTTTGAFPISQDSALYVPNGTPNPFYWWVEGLGTSFDPTSYAFKTGSGGGFQNPTPMYAVPAFTVANTDAYTVDSVTISGYYQKVKTWSAPDTLIVDFVVCSSGQSTNFTLHYNAYSGFIPVDPLDSQIFWATGSYKPFYGGFSSDSNVAAVRWVHVFSSPTDTGGQDYKFPISISAPAGGKISAIQHFRSAHQYLPAQQVSIDSANLWEPLCYQINGAGAYPNQKPSDYNCGLIADRHIYYGDDTAKKYNTFQSHFVLDPTYAYGPISASSKLYIQDPFFAFHLNCTSCAAVGVETVKNLVGHVEAFPNPATGNVTIEFTTNQSANVNVSLVNMVGQVVKTQNAGLVQHGGTVNFDVSTLAPGIYFYVLNANGEINTGRIVVAH